MVRKHLGSALRVATFARTSSIPATSTVWRRQLPRANLSGQGTTEGNFSGLGTRAAGNPINLLSGVFVIAGFGGAPQERELDVFAVVGRQVLVGRTHRETA